jgi:hypothetical protein
MKMNIWTLFVGGFFIVLGADIILKSFGINIHFFRFAFAALVIFIGIRILIPGKGGMCCGNVTSTTGRETMFAESRIDGSDIAGEYSVIFGANKMDLTKVEVKGQTVKIKIDVVFGGAEVKLDTAKPIRIVASAVFGGVTLPNGNAAAFGTNIYQSPSYKEGSPHILIEANSVFGGIEIK